ncbi:anti-sigma factor [Thermoactinomyces sp. DSM 45892]|uniref:anti-sigma factor family protein n=1 Tax=Thermoactinomyces sp. DSM 45892 TaxID=1882753 RepID=UPI00089CBCF9|nr:zf-HC2 domain-containing protein [Thermoactinomyces sp. DSM 45892]SDY13449.1 Putative zinc-finger [Thermoactinomyces sp. DSM 45892]
MVCKDEMLMQSYLDGELTRDERKQIALHIEKCPECLAWMNEMKDLEDWTRIHITDSFPQIDEALDIDVDRAWAHVSEQIEIQEKQMRQPIQMQEKSVRGRWRDMKKNTKRWISGVAAAAVVIGGFSIPQVQAAASELLSAFRVDKVELVKLTEKDLQQMEAFLQNKELGNLDLKGMGKIWTEGEKKKDRHREYDTYEQAVKKEDSLPKKPEGYTVSNINVTDPMKVNFQLNTEKVNKVLKQLDGKVDLENKLNGKTFSIEVPKTTMLTLRNTNHDFHYMVASTPQLKVDKDVDVAKLRDSILSLPFIPTELKRQLMAIQDWQSTLPIPVVEGMGKVSEVQVNGVKGTMMEEEDGAAVLLWQRDGKIHTLSVYQNGADRLIELAKKLDK